MIYSDSNAPEYCVTSSHIAGPEVKIFEYDDLALLEAELAGYRDREQMEAATKLLQSIKKTGTKRRLTVLDQNARVRLEEMRIEFPNFLEVIDYISRYAEIAWHTDGVLRFAPILLTGPAGIGKTRFAERFASWSASSFHRIAIASSQNGSELSGSSSFWSNAAPGIIFNTLIQGNFANPLIFLDEIDKASTDSRYDALGALYVLLEPSSAAKFQDQCYRLPLNASNISYIAACNYPESIPHPIRTRFREFEISIYPDHMERIAVNIINTARLRLFPAAESIIFSARAIHTLSKMTPRKVEQTVTEAIGDCLLHNYRIVDNIFINEKASQRIGFLP
jgi:ATP-dependent Lon protease